jgi:hypothetical protein
VRSRWGGTSPDRAAGPTALEAEREYAVRRTRPTHGRTVQGEPEGVPARFPEEIQVKIIHAHEDDQLAMAKLGELLAGLVGSGREIQ